MSNIVGGVLFAGALAVGGFIMTNQHPAPPAPIAGPKTGLSGSGTGVSAEDPKRFPTAPETVPVKPTDTRDLTQPEYSFKAMNCEEDEPCWVCSEMGNHICGDAINPTKVSTTKTKKTSSSSAKTTKTTTTAPPKPKPTTAPKAPTSTPSTAPSTPTTTPSATGTKMPTTMPNTPTAPHFVSHVAAH